MQAIDMLLVGFNPILAGFGHMRGWGWGMAGLGLLTMLAVIGLVVWLVIFLARSTGPTSRPPASEGRAPVARELLDERYARGEIGREEYLRMREDLEN